MGWQVPGPRSSVNCVNVKLNYSGLASGSMPGRCRSGVRDTGNFTPLPKLASSLSFFFPGPRSISWNKRPESLRAAMNGPRQEQVRPLRCSPPLSRRGFLEVVPRIPASEGPGYSKCGAAMKLGQNEWMSPEKSRSFLFQIQTIRLINATFLIAKRKSMNWTDEVDKP
jgi:hypothetical protein